MRDAFAAALALGLVMTLGDLAWAALHIRHRVAYGLIHGAVMCLCVGLAIGIRSGHAGRAAIAGPIIGVVAAAAFYALAPALRWGAMFPAWMLLWILFAFLQQRLRKNEQMTAAAVRGLVASVLSGIAFYLISGIWTRGSHDSPYLPLHFAAWSFAFLPGFAVLFRDRAAQSRE
jgi:hypothetical protein